MVNRNALPSRRRALQRLVTKRSRRAFKRLRDRVKARERLAQARTARYRWTYRTTLARVPMRAELPHVFNRRGLLDRGVEVGVAKGNFSDLILQDWQGRELISVDPWIEVEENYSLARRRLERHGSRSTMWRMTSEEAAREIAPRSLDFVYIDADHGFESVQSDLVSWYEKVRPGGILAGHDYFDRPGGRRCEVKTAVDRFAAARGLRVHSTFAEPEKVKGGRARSKAISWLLEVPAASDARSGSRANR